MNRNFVGYTVDTSLNPGAGVAEIITSFTSFDGMKEEITRRVIKTEDQAIRDALIALGWTPPAPSNPVHAIRSAYVDAMVLRTNAEILGKSR